MFPLIPSGFHKMTTSGLRLTPAPVETRPLFSNSHKDFGVESLTESDDPTPRALVGSLSTWNYVQLKEKTRWFLPNQTAEFRRWRKEWWTGKTTPLWGGLRGGAVSWGAAARWKGVSGTQTPQLRTTGSRNFPCGVGGTIHDAESGWTAHCVKRPSPISTRANMSW